jgi:hypothetical protein
LSLPYDDLGCPISRVLCEKWETTDGVPGGPAFRVLCQGRPSQPSENKNPRPSVQKPEKQGARELTSARKAGPSPVHELGKGTLFTRAKSAKNSPGLQPLRRSLQPQFSQPAKQVSSSSPTLEYDTALRSPEDRLAEMRKWLAATERNPDVYLPPRDRTLWTRGELYAAFRRYAPETPLSVDAFGHR